MISYYRTDSIVALQFPFRSRVVRSTSSLMILSRMDSKTPVPYKFRFFIGAKNGHFQSYPKAFHSHHIRRNNSSTFFSANSDVFIYWCKMHFFPIRIRNYAFTDSVSYDPMKFVHVAPPLSSRPMRRRVCFLDCAMALINALRFDLDWSLDWNIDQ